MRSIFVYLLWRNVYLNLSIFWLGCFFFILGCLHHLEINLLLVALFTNIFSHSVGCLFIFFMISFAVQKLLSLVSHLFIYFINIMRWIQKENWCNLCQSFLLMFSTRSFIVSDLTFRPLIHFHFIFVYGIRDCSNFPVSCVAVKYSQYHLLKRLSFLHCISLPPLS